LAASFQPVRWENMQIEGDGFQRILQAAGMAGPQRPKGGPEKKSRNQIDS
jgi:hypothetical protein